MIYKRPDSIVISVDQYISEYGNEDAAKKRFFNIGSGTWMHPCWSNLDLPAQTPEFAAIQAPCIHHDLVNESKLPIPSNSAHALYCSHVVEHLPDHAVMNLLEEAFRCLEKGGVFRIVTGPCADLDWQALLRSDKDWWFWNDDIEFKESVEKDKEPMSVYDRWLYHMATPRSLYSRTPCIKKYSSAEIAGLVSAHESKPQDLWNLLTNSLEFNNCSPGDHLSWWNYDKLSANLLKAGFADVRRSGYGQSHMFWMRDLRYFDQTYPQISVYVEVTK